MYIARFLAAKPQNLSRWEFIGLKKWPTLAKRPATEFQIEFATYILRPEIALKISNTTIAPMIDEIKLGSELPMLLNELTIG